MTVSYVTKIALSFSELQSAFGDIKINVSAPWHFNESKGCNIPFAAEHGLYLYTKPNIPEWHVSAEINENQVWYIGKSAGNIGGRVWKHVCPIYDPETKLECVPRFKYHRWMNVPSVPSDVQESISNGDIVVYTISVRTEQPSPLIAELFEKYVLVKFVLAHGRTPILNLQM